MIDIFDEIFGIWTNEVMVHPNNQPPSQQKGNTYSFIDWNLLSFWL
jgi:hypothetical protein